MASLNYKTEDGWKKVAGGKTGVLTFKGRAGVVTPKEGDYTAEMVGARPNTWMPNIAEVGGVNPNLLDNWYFGNPVNQRGQTKYAGTRQHCIDRWKLHAGTTEYDVSTGTMTCTQTTWSGILQTVEAEALGGKTVTASFLLESDIPLTLRLLALYDETNYIDNQQIFQPTNGIISATWTVPEGTPILDVQLINNLNNPEAGTVVLKAAKLELGSTQTLAHQDADGNWVLNEIPNYGEELMKCQRYQFELNLNKEASLIFGNATKAADGVWFFTIPTPVPLRATPQLIKAPSAINLNTFEGIFPTDEIGVAGCHASSISLVLTMPEGGQPPSAQTGIPYVLESDEGSPLSMLFDANL